MPAYKDEKRGTWYAMFYYKDWNGELKRKKKRGFKRERDAKEFEREFLFKNANDPNMTFGSLYELYVEDQDNRIRYGTKEKKTTIFDKYILPYFKNRKIAEITPGDIRQWQNQMLNMTNPRNGEPYAETYLRHINSELTAILNYAVQFHGLDFNPAAKVKPIGKKQSREMLFWTLDEFNKAMEYEDKAAYHLCFMILYWCGLREGEALALTPGKIIHESKSLNIYETYHKIKGEDIFGPTKTDNSKRQTPMPDFVYDELMTYLESIMGIGNEDRIFYFSKSGLNKELDRIAKESGIKRIRVHDLRHSHVSLLIKLGYRTHAIADRIGDTPEVVDRVYAHLYPDVSNEIVQELNKHQKGFNTVPQNSDVSTEKSGQNG